VTVISSLGVCLSLRNLDLSGILSPIEHLACKDKTTTWSQNVGQQVFRDSLIFQKTEDLNYSHATHNDVSVNNGPHIRRWSHKIIIL